MDSPGHKSAAEANGNGLLVNALRRENQRLWAEIEARQAADRERARSLTPTQSADAFQAWERPSQAAPAHDTKQQAAAEQRLLDTLTAAISLAVHDECQALGAALQDQFARLSAEAESRLRTEHWDTYTALAARLDRITGELEQMRNELRELVEAHRAGSGYPVIIEYPRAEADTGNAAPDER